MHGQLRDQLGDMLRCKELAAGFAGVGGVVGDEEFVGIAEQVDLVIFKITVMRITKIQFGHAFKHGGQTEIFVFDGVAEAVAGGVEIREQAFDVLLGRVAVGGAFNGGKDGSQVGVQAFVGIGAGSDLGEELAGVDEIALGFDGVIFDVRGNDVVGQLDIVDAVVTAFDVGRKVFADEAVKQGAEHVLPEVPSVDSTTDIVGDGPDLALQDGALLDAVHAWFPVESFTFSSSAPPARTHSMYSAIW